MKTCKKIICCCIKCDQPIKQCCTKYCCCKKENKNGCSNNGNVWCPVPKAPILLYPADGEIIESFTPTLVGRAEPLSQIVLCIDGSCITTNADLAGTFTFTTDRLNYGQHTITIQQTNYCGNRSAITTSIFSIVSAPNLAVISLQMGSQYRTVDAVIHLGNFINNLTLYYLLLDPTLPEPTASEIMNYTNETNLINGTAARGIKVISPDASGSDLQLNLRGREIANPLPQETGVVDGFPYKLYILGVTSAGSETNIASSADSAIGMPFESGSGSANDPFVIRDYALGELTEYPDQYGAHPINRAGIDETGRQLDNIEGMQLLNDANPSFGLPNTLSLSYTLASNVNLENYLSAYQGDGWRPIGNYDTNTSHVFTGNFNGNNYTVSNLSITTSTHNANNTGFFGVTHDAVIENLSVSNATLAPITQSGSSLIGAISANSNRTRISNIYLNNINITMNYGSTNAINNYAGGLVGQAVNSQLYDITVIGVRFNDNSSYAAYLGGLVGYGFYNDDTAYSVHGLSLTNISLLNYIGTAGVVFGGGFGVINSESSMQFYDITATSIQATISNMCAGGFIGRIYVSGPVTAEDITTAGISLHASVSGYNFIGGVIGDAYLYDTFKISRAQTTNATLSSYSSCGGIIGHIGENNNGSCVIEDCSALVSATAILSYAGGIVGALSREAVSYFFIDNCQTLTGSTIESPNQAGGIIGDLFHTQRTAYAYIANCVNHAVISGATGRYLGGIIGFGNYVAVSNCSSDSSVTGNTGEFSVGGLFGELAGCYVTSCNCTGTVTGHEAVGGFGGYVVGLEIPVQTYTPPFATKDNVIELCYSKGNVNAYDDGVDVGGFIGRTLDITYQENFASGNITANNSENVGGFIGSRKNNVYTQSPFGTDNYATGNVINASENAGGLVGESEVDITRGFAHGNVAGSSNIAGIVGISQANTVNTFALQSEVRATGSPSARIGNGGTYNSNYAISTMSLYENNAIKTATEDSNGQDGLAVSAANLQAQMEANGYTSTIWNFSSLTTKGYPTLVNNPE